MAQQLAFNMDCMEAMRQMKDNEFDLAIVDPPYGSGLASEGGCQGLFAKYHQGDSQTVNVEREREREPSRVTGTGSDSISTATSNRLMIPRGGWHNKHKYHSGSQTWERGNMEQAEPGERGQRSLQKNHCVGRCAETGIFRGAVSRLTKSDYMGRQLLLAAADKVFSDLAQDECPGKLQHGYG